MPAIGRTLAALVLRGDDLDPGDVTQLLGVEPSSAARMGDVRRPGGDPNKVFRTGHWRLEAEALEPGNLDQQICNLLARLPSEPETWGQLTSRFSGEVFCGLFMNESNEMSELRPETLALMAERGLTLTLDLYDPGRVQPTGGAAIKVR